jgi:rhodanese-related sulfurtransferase
MYVLYDNDGSLAAQAATRMSNEGYWGYAYYIAGGLARWHNDLGTKFFTGSQAALPPASAEGSVGLLAKLPVSVASKYRVVIDLSAASSFAQSRIPGSVNLTEQEAVAWAQTLPELLGLSTVSEVVVWVLDDGDGSAACRAAQQLLDMGFIASCIQGGRAALLADTGSNFLWAVSDE